MSSRSAFAAAAFLATAAPALAGGGCVGDCYRQVVTPPRYETVSEKVLLRAPRTYTMVRPAEYDTVHETVQVRPASRYWSVSYDAWGNKVGCWITKPAKYATVARTVMTRPAEAVPYQQAAVWGYRSHDVLVEPARKQWVPAGGGFGGLGLGGFSLGGLFGGSDY